MQYKKTILLNICKISLILIFFFFYFQECYDSLDLNILNEIIEVPQRIILKETIWKNLI